MITIHFSVQVDDVQKSKVFNINDDEPSAETDPTEDEELLQEPEDNNQIQSDTDASKYFVLIGKYFLKLTIFIKYVLLFSDDMNLKEFDSTITHTSKFSN